MSLFFYLFIFLKRKRKKKVPFYNFRDSEIKSNENFFFLKKGVRDTIVQLTSRNSDIKPPTSASPYRTILTVFLAMTSLHLAALTPPPHNLDVLSTSSGLRKNALTEHHSFSINRLDTVRTPLIG